MNSAYPYPFQAVIVSALVSTLIAPTLYGVFIGEPADLPWFLVFIVVNTVGLPVVFSIFLVTCAILWILNARGITHILAYCLCGAGLGTWAPVIGGLAGWEWHFHSDNVPFPYGSFFAGAMAGCLGAFIGNMFMRLLSRSGIRDGGA